LENTPAGGEGISTDVIWGKNMKRGKLRDKKEERGKKKEKRRKKKGKMRNKRVK
jgi:hypothetical protein